MSSGKWLEEFIGRAAQDYERRNIMTLEKVDPPTRVVYQNGKPTAIMLRNPFVDFVGVWRERGGRAIFLEAKSTEKETLALANDGGLTQRQWDAIRRWHSAGAATGLLWGYRNEIRFVSSRLISDTFLTGRKSLRWEEAAPCAKGTGFITFDFAVNLRAAH